MNSSRIDYNKLSPVRRSQSQNHSDSIVSSLDYSTTSTLTRTGTPMNDVEPPAKVIPSDFLSKSRIPKMIQPTLPSNLLNKFNIPQLRLEDILRNKSHTQYTLSPSTINTHNEPTAYRQDDQASPASSSSSLSPPPPPTSSTVSTTTTNTGISNHRLESPINNTNSNTSSSSSSLPHHLNSKKESLITKAKNLKHLGESNYNNHLYKLAFLNFIESLLLFITEFHTKELRNNSSESIGLRARERDWFGLVKYNNKIIENFTNINIQSNKQGNGGGKSIELTQMLGLLNYLNAAMILHVHGLNNTQLKFTIKKMTDLPRTIEHNGNFQNSKEFEELTDSLVQLNIKVLRLDKSSKSFLRKGEFRMGVRFIQEKFPGVFYRSKKAKEVNLSSEDLEKEPFGGGYYLPVVSHGFVDGGEVDLLVNVVNFSLAILKRWCDLENVEYQWSL